MVLGLGLGLGYTLGGGGSAQANYDISNISPSPARTLSLIGFDNITNPQDFVFSSDGSRLYVSESGSCVQLSLATPWNINTASQEYVFDTTVDAGAGIPFIGFSSDGITFIALNQSDRLFHQWTLSTPWDLETASYDEDIDTSWPAVTQRFCFSNDGGMVFVIRPSMGEEPILQTFLAAYSLGTPFDITTINLSVVGIMNVLTLFSSTALLCPYVTPDGTKCAVTSNGSDTIYQADFGDPLDVTTLTYNDILLNVGDSGIDTPRAARWGNSGVSLFVMGNGNLLEFRG